MGHITDSWFSASLRFLIAVDKSDREYEDSVVVFRAAEWDSAFARALEIGRQMEESYRNVQGEPVTKRLLAISTLDQLDNELIDGREVYCTRGSLVSNELVAEPRPEESKPRQSGV